MLISLNQKNLYVYSHLKKILLFNYPQKDDILKMGII